ncbi:Sugar transferase involved in LPS biosynthesis (colanic, teichoic acid) [Deinococcus reticulitermitis]|uniref:Sugar transferase involved in LPS biosynthesis (Colanic, teichoic acid) n=1 Tax=Deinococcus reticulitermitis TaxID=856736 RepID=A0A1H7B714_9DEIO|nr:sugar transferase [Deinococcus reticulitermitis]SEJ70252.1 Sugar transferase involved in LPS biosynthesis (colanic, teichoic acid) [Deinococcus reticulitermitis]
MRDLILLLLGLLAAEFAELTPSLMAALVRWAARSLPESHRELYEEAWLAELDACPGKLWKLRFAFSLLWSRAEVAEALREAEGWPPRPVQIGLQLVHFLELTFVLLTLAALGPLLLILTLVICLDSPGPPMYAYRALGRGMRPIELRTFRTTRTDTPHRLTRVGRFLKVSALDRLPLLVSVIQGDCALLGPNVHVVRRFPELGRTLCQYQRPGIVGVGDLVEAKDADQRLEAWLAAEHEYIQNWSAGRYLSVMYRIVMRVCLPL